MIEPSESIGATCSSLAKFSGIWSTDRARPVIADGPVGQEAAPMAGELVAATDQHLAEKRDVILVRVDVAFAPLLSDTLLDQFSENSLVRGDVVVVQAESESQNKFHCMTTM